VLLLFFCCYVLLLCSSCCFKPHRVRLSVQRPLNTEILLTHSDRDTDCDNTLTDIYRPTNFTYIYIYIYISLYIFIFRHGQKGLRCSSFKCVTSVFDHDDTTPVVDEYDEKVVYLYICSRDRGSIINFAKKKKERRKRINDMTYVLYTTNIYKYIHNFPHRLFVCRLCL